MFVGIFGGDTEIYDDRGLLDEHISSLSPCRYRRYEALKPEGSRKLSVLSSHLIDEGLRAYGLREKDMEYGHSVKGRPFFMERPDIRFSISHSGTRAMVCMTGPFNGNMSAEHSGISFFLTVIPDDGEKKLKGIGCDIERIRPYSVEYEGITARFFHEDEASYIAGRKNDTEKADAFTKIWTLKESYIKALGTGLSEGIETFGIIPNDRGVILKSSKLMHLSQDCYFLDIELPEGYRSSFCAVYE